MNYIKIAERVLKGQRKGMVTPPEVKPVLWKGIHMTIDEAWAVICAFEKKKAAYLARYRNTETGATITETVFHSLSETTNTVGRGLKPFPVTTLVGWVVGGTSQGISNVGETIGKGVREINPLRNTPQIDEISEQINSLTWVIEAVSRETSSEAN
ncbi:hypothetical protein IQ273_21215 [Nodosilinea sp. LEGE 07298]|uniref:hypothetical protein n=1 Tax=Nodosilinea sp. LEGE 07298 TaxID=2777970 RepID=UPI00187F6B36|nr:hypothetical protein [Nodosilinea sp. LEGE 07298]MBE9111930.1 hypothetical protein [Nodosilinea sp. LEGE 07298]